MIKKLLLLLVITMLLMAFTEVKTGAVKDESTPYHIPPSMAMDTSGAKKFWEMLKLHCGKAFEGEIISAPAGDDFRDKRLVMHVLSCSDEEILIPFNVGDNRSRTWVLTYKNGRITLKHDHRHEDGSPDKITLYGGTTPNSGLPGIAVFPADEETALRIPAAATNVWWLTVEETKYTYNLRRIGSDRLFSVAFDLTKAIETPAPSWGWEEYGGAK